MVKTTQEIFTENIRRLRKSLRLSQETFAEKVGLSERGYQKYEQHESSPTPEILDRFSKVLKCRPWELVQPLELWKTSPKEVTDLLIAKNEALENKLKFYDELIGNVPEEVIRALRTADRAQMKVIKSALDLGPEVNKKSATSARSK